MDKRAKRLNSPAFKRKVALGSLNAHIRRDRIRLADTTGIFTALDRIKDILDTRLAARRKESSK